MNTLAVFREHKKALVDRWVEMVFSTYSLDTTGLLRTRQDQFANPVGEITTTLASYLYDAVAGEHIIPERVTEALTRFVRLRAVQDFSPSRGLGVIYVLKHFLRETLLPIFEADKSVADYLEAEARLDTLALMAFDIYLGAREAVSEQRIKEIRDQHSQVLRFAQAHGHTPDLA